MSRNVFTFRAQHLKPAKTKLVKRYTSDSIPSLTATEPLRVCAGFSWPRENERQTGKQTEKEKKHRSTGRDAKVQINYRAFARIRINLSERFRRCSGTATWIFSRRFSRGRCLGNGRSARRPDAFHLHRSYWRINRQITVESSVEHRPDSRLDKRCLAFDRAPPHSLRQLKQPAPVPLCSYWSTGNNVGNDRVWAA